MKRAEKGTIGNNKIAFKMPKDMLEKLRALADLKYFGNESMVIRLALMEYFEKPEIKQLLKLSKKAPAPSPQEAIELKGGERA